MAKIKYGVEYVSTEQDNITMYASKEAAMAAAEGLLGDMKPGECVSLFYADCDEDGKLATSEFNIVKVWDK